MLAHEIRQYNVNFDKLIQDPLNEKLLETLTTFSKALALYGYSVRICSEKSLSKLNEIPPEKKRAINKYFENWCEWIAPVNGSTDIAEINTKKEIVFLKRALDYYGLHVDDDFFKTIDENDLIEFYGEDMVQLYRSLSFFDVSGYSLLDLSLYEWYVLFERPRLVLEKINKEVQRVIEQPSAVSQFQVVEHILRETYDTGKTEPFIPRSVLVKFRNIGTVRKVSETGRPIGFVCSCHATVIAEGAEAYSMGFV